MNVKEIKRTRTLKDGSKLDENYLTRYHIIPRNKYFNVYLHQFLGSDLDKALHDHPWYSVSVILKGTYKEVVPIDPVAWSNNTDRRVKYIYRTPGSLIFRAPNSIHRIELLVDTSKPKNTLGNKYLKSNETVVNGTELPVWTLFITGPVLRSWGFWCPQGFVDNKIFLTPDGLSVGQGCD
jgi:hypothetical protein